MVIDHIGLFFLSNHEFLRLVGRGAAPIFFFLVGYSNSIKIGKNLIISATFLQVLMIIFEIKYQLNILFTILFLRFLNKFIQNRFFKISLYSAILIIIWCLVLLLPFSIIEYSSLAFLPYALGRMISSHNKKHLLGIYQKTCFIILIFTLSYWFGLTILGFSYMPYIMLFYLMLIFGLFIKMDFSPYPNKIKKYHLIIYNLGKYSLSIYYLHYAIFALIGKSFIHFIP